MVSHQIPAECEVQRLRRLEARLTSSLLAPPRLEDRDHLLWQESTAPFRWYDTAGNAGSASRS